MPTLTGQALEPAVDMRVHLDGPPPSVPQRWFVNEYADLWLFLRPDNALFVAAFDDTTVTLHVAARPEAVLPVPLEDFHTGYFVQE